MPYARPTLTQLRVRAMQDITSSDLPGVDGFLKKAVLRVLAWVMAGFAWLHYDFLDWISLQSVPWTATDEYLAAWMALIDVQQEDATAASGTATFTGTAGTINPGTIVNRLDGFSYTVTAPGTISGGTVTVPVEAATVGSIGNADEGTVLVLADPIPGINSEGTAAADIVGGADQETSDAFRLRGLAEFAARPQGGDMADYIEWSLAIPGITRAWVIPNGKGAGTVVVYVMLDVANAGADGGFPQGNGGVATNETRDTAATGDLLTVANALYPQRPVTALVYAEPPAAQPQNFTITNLGANNTSANQSAITAALNDMFLRLANVGGTVNPTTGAAWPAITPDKWYDAIAAVPGLTTFDVTVPSGPISPSATGNLFTVGTITFTP